MYVHIYVWKYPSKSYTPFPSVKIAKIKDMATWLESGTKATAQCPCPRFLKHSTVRHTDTDTPEQTDTVLIMPGFQHSSVPRLLGTQGSRITKGHRVQAPIHS